MTGLSTAWMTDNQEERLRRLEDRFDDLLTRLVKVGVLSASDALSLGEEGYWREVPS